MAYMKYYSALGNLNFLQDITCNIHIWSSNLAVSYEKVSKYYKYLSPYERHRAESLKFEKDRNLFVVFRGVLRKILSIYINLPPEKILIEHTNFGKPILRNYPGTGYLYFNSSRSNNLALYIFSGLYEVGIDIEEVREIDNFEDIISQFFAPEEISDFNKIQPQELIRTFYKTWTKKEAFVKAIGVGLSFPLSQFQVSIMPSKEDRIIQIDGDFSEAAKWSINGITTFLECEAAYVYRGHNANTKFLTFNYKSNSDARIIKKI